MRTLIHNADLKRLHIGAAVAVVAGLALGAAVQPALQEGILAPQQKWAGGGLRTYATASEPGIGAYPDKVPDYVIGTNYTQPPPVAEPPTLEFDEGPQLAAYDAAEYAGTAEAVAPWRREDDQDYRGEAPHYPSMRGNAYNPSDLPDPPEPPVEEFDPA